MTASVVLLLMFLAASLGIAASYSIWNDLFRRPPSRTRQRMEAEFGKEPGHGAGRSLLFKAVGPLDFKPGPRGAARAEEVLGAAEGKDLRSRLDVLLAQSGLPITRKQFAYISLAGGGLLAAAGLAGQGGVLALAGLLAGAAAPLLYVRARCHRRQQRFLTQLPGAFDLMARVLRAGHSVPQAFQAVADTFEEPIAGEFSFCQEQQNLGLLPEVTFRDLARRADVLEMKIFVMAMLVQRQTGGNLSEVLERLAQLVRDRSRLRNHVRTLTAEGRMQAAVLLVLPVLLFFVMRAINPRYTDVLLEHPSLLAGAGVAMGLGAFWIRKIIHFDF